VERSDINIDDILKQKKEKVREMMSARYKIPTQIPPNVDIENNSGFDSE
jgi:hypothetical protein